MDWEDLKYFIELARCGTLSGAARSLRAYPSREDSAP
jgi:DNA-binding transcriptional LysR family regulator